MKTDVIGETEDRITSEALSNSSTKLVQASSILMVVRSGILSHTFPVAVCDRPITLNQDMRALTPLDGIVAWYLAYFLRRFQRRILETCSKDGTTVASVDPGRLEEMFVPIAPTAEQNRIVKRIDELFADIAEGEIELARARESLSTLRGALLRAFQTQSGTASALRQSILKAAFEGKLVLQNTDDEAADILLVRLSKEVFNPITVSSRRRQRAFRRQ